MDYATPLKPKQNKIPFFSRHEQPSRSRSRSRSGSRMAYRRRQGPNRSLTFIDQSRASSPSFTAVDDAQSPSASSSASSSALRSPITASRRDLDPKNLRRSATYSAPKGTVTYEYTSMRSLNETKYGFWGILARKAKAILEDDAPLRTEDHGGIRRLRFDSSTGSQLDQSHQSPFNNRKTENPVHDRSAEFASSLHQIGGTIKDALEEGLSGVENRTADILQETRKLHIRRKSTSSLGQNQAADPLASNYIYTNLGEETQLKASRDVANAMAAKAKLLLRELKTVKADLAFSKERCTQLEDENKLLRESRDKGDHLEDEDLIRLQLETLLEEKGRLAHENELYARENRFLREIVDYHQLTMQDVIYVNEADEEADDEVCEVCPIQMHSHSHNSASDHLSPIFSRAGSSINSTPRSYIGEDTPEDVITTAFSTSPSSPASPPVVMLETEEEIPLDSPTSPSSPPVVLIKTEEEIPLKSPTSLPVVLVKTEEEVPLDSPTSLPVVLMKTEKETPLHSQSKHEGLGLQSDYISPI